MRALAVLVAAVTLAAPAPAGHHPPYTAVGFSAAHRSLIDWALERFAAAGLEVPHLAFELHGDREACRGARGFYTGDGSTVRICTPEIDGFVEVLYLHEIAHAWDVHSLDDSRRDAFLDLRDLDVWWDDGSAPWHTFGAEHAAQIVAWGLLDRPITVATIPDADGEQLRRGFVLLTGRQPLGQPSA